MAESFDKMPPSGVWLVHIMVAMVTKLGCFWNLANPAKWTDKGPSIIFNGPLFTNSCIISV